MPIFIKSLYYMPYKLIVLLCLIGIVYTPSHAQDIKVLGKNAFEHSGNSYDRYTLRSVMESNTEALEQYEQYIRLHGNLRIRRNVGGGAMIGGAILTLVGFGNAINGNSGDAVYLGILSTSMGAVLVISSFVRKKHLLDKAIDIYNTKPPDMGMQQPYLNLGLTANGVGVVYQF